MTSVEMITWFDTIQDKLDGVYFELDEKLNFLNKAQSELINELAFQYLFKARAGVSSKSPSATTAPRVFSSIESTQAAQEVLEPLTINEIPITSPSSGILARADIKTAMNVISGDSSDYMKVTSVSKDLSGEDVLVKFVRQNDYLKFKSNSFKVATVEEPQYVVSRNQIKTYPVGANDFLISVVKYPIEVVVDEATPANNVDSELPAFTHVDILNIALNLAAVSSRDVDLIQAKRIINDSLSTLA